MNNTGKRIASIDILRGLVMVIMALDHVRDYFHDGAMLGNPLDPDTTTPFLYFTRWITHYCAPVFVFLSGVSAYLSASRKSKAEASVFLIKRGIFLILAEFTVVTFGWTFDPLFSKLVMQVIWAIGFSMLILGLLIRLPQQFILPIALLIIVGHNAIDRFEPGDVRSLGFVWDALHHGGFNSHTFAPGHAFLVVYPVLPWTGIMLLGYAFGRCFTPGFDAVRRKRILLLSALAMLLVFVLLRIINAYGDPGKWQTYATPLQTMMAFLDVSKYPPSLLYTCMTLAPALLFLAFDGQGNDWLSRQLTVFGKVPFFYYILHIYAIHLLCVLLFFASGYGINDIATQHSMFYFRPAEMGFSLPVVWLIWLLLITGLYFPCRWYNQYRSGKAHWIFRYI